MKADLIFIHDVREAWGSFPVSQGEREQTAQARAPRLVPGAASNAAFLACLQEPFRPQRLYSVWKGSTLALLVGVCWGRRAFASLLRPPTSLASPLFPFTLMVDVGSPRAGCSEAPIFSQPPLLDLGGQPLPPPVTQKRMLAHRAAQKERALGEEEGCF